MKAGEVIFNVVTCRGSPWPKLISVVLVLCYLIYYIDSQTFSVNHEWISGYLLGNRSFYYASHDCKCVDANPVIHFKVIFGTLYFLYYSLFKVEDEQLID